MTTNKSKKKTTPQRDAEEVVSSLTPEQQAALSKALFPETHTTEVTLVGVSRKLRPIPVSVAREVHAISSSLTEHLQAVLLVAEDDDAKEPEDLTEESLEVLSSVTACLAKYYGWEDLQDVKYEETLSVSEMQELWTVQTELNGENDFLLAGLRMVINIWRIQEVMNLTFHSMLTTRPSSKPGIAASTS